MRMNMLAVAIFCVLVLCFLQGNLLACNYDFHSPFREVVPKQPEKEAEAEAETELDFDFKMDFEEDSIEVDGSIYRYYDERGISSLCAFEGLAMGVS